MISSDDFNNRLLESIGSMLTNGEQLPLLKEFF